jgi:hypothetical protein
MTQKMIATAMWITFLLGMAIAPHALADQSAKKRIVIHMTESSPEKWNIVLNNASNVRDELGKDNVQIEIVTHGPGINMLKMESVVGTRLKTALDNGISLVACEFTMRAAKVTKDDMYEGISYAPSGVARIIERQADGWYYLRP